MPSFGSCFGGSVVGNLGIVGLEKEAFSSSADHWATWHVLHEPDIINIREHFIDH
jgi:hypothetical protein